MGAPPAAHEEATVDQLSALRDFFVKMATSGLQLGGDGQFLRAQPPDNESWSSAFKVLKPACISLGLAALLARNGCYGDHIHKLSVIVGRLQHDAGECFPRRCCQAQSPACIRRPS
eukprot:2851167-Amphidinium_carterae.1